MDENLETTGVCLTNSVKADTPCSRFAKESSKCPALLSHERVFRRLQNSCLFVVIVRSGESLVLSTTEATRVTPKTRN